MDWKIIIENYIGAFVIFLIWFLGALLSGWIFNKSGEYNKLTLIGTCIILIVLFIGATIRTSIELTKSKKDQITTEEKQTLSPKVDIKLFPLPDKALTTYKYPLKRYDLLIHNQNSNSVPLLNFRIEFIFRNIIFEVKQKPILYTTGNISVSGLEIYEKKKDGSIISYIEQPVETEITKSFSLKIQKVKINKKEINSNIAFFNCEKWPNKTSFSGVIVIDLSKKPKIQKKPDKVGKYEGIYYYEIKGEKFSEKINGTIPDVGYLTNKNSKNYWLQKLSNIDPNMGTIEFWTSDDKWLERNNIFVEFIPHLVINDFEIHVYRDIDNIFKVLISNPFSKKIILKYENLDNLKHAPSHPKHMIVITWDKEEKEMYIDGDCVDTYP